MRGSTASPATSTPGLSARTPLDVIAPSFGPGSFDRHVAALLEQLGRANLRIITETPGPYAGPTYDAFALLWLALAQAEETGGGITRATVQEALGGLEYEGITGTVFQP